MNEVDSTFNEVLLPNGSSNKWKGMSSLTSRRPTIIQTVILTLVGSACLSILVLTLFDLPEMHWDNQMKEDHYQMPVVICPPNGAPQLPPPPFDNDGEPIGPPPGNIYFDGLEPAVLDETTPEAFSRWSDVCHCFQTIYFFFALLIARISK